jgi:hypothetical protein
MVKYYASNGRNWGLDGDFWELKSRSATEWSVSEPFTNIDLGDGEDGDAGAA